MIVSIIHSQAQMTQYLQSEQPVETKLAYAMAVFTVAVWGLTFINTKLLMQMGLTAADIVFYRTAIAWIGLFCSCPRPVLAGGTDELRLAILGVFGGSAYFLLENTALETSQAGNVSFLVSSSPIFAVLLGMIFYRDIKASWRFWIGSWIALAGIVCLLYNGVLELNLWPWGDILGLAAGLSWAVYSLLLRPLFGRYSVDFITRKVMFWTLVSLTPVFAFEPLTTDWELLTRWEVLPQLLFLGLIAQTLCFTLWNDVTRSIGAAKTSNFLYLCPVVTVVAGVWLLDEKWTPVMLIGCALVLVGVWLCHGGIKRK